MRIDEIRKRLKEISTQEPWIVDIAGVPISNLDHVIEGTPRFFRMEDVWFICHAPADVEWMLKRLELYEEVLLEIKDGNEHLHVLIDSVVYK